MLFFPFDNYAGFKEMFGTRECNNGNRATKNKILLAFFRSNSARRWCKENNVDFYAISSMAALKNVLLGAISLPATDPNANVHLMKYHFAHPSIKTDGYNGICEDGTSIDGFVRYINDRGQLFKQRMGRVMKAVCEAKGLDVLPEQALRWFEEQMTETWRAYAINMLPYELHIDENYKDIYDGSKCSYDFGSCMQNTQFWKFYRDCVEAKAAYLTDTDGTIVARAIIFTKVYTTDGKTIRLCERQYAKSCSDVLKRTLVNKLIEAGAIDGYKAIGAGCHEERAFVRIDGTPFEGEDSIFSIDCHIDRSEDWVSYQDSFKYYDEYRGKAHNNEEDSYDYTLTMTNGLLDPEYDEWDHEDVREVFYAYRDGEGYNVSVDNRDDYVELNGDWYYEGDVIECSECGDLFPNPDIYGSHHGEWSELTEEWYDCESCKEQAEQDYKEANWYYSEYDEEYYEDEEDVISALKWNPNRMEWEKTTISRESLDDLLSSGEAHRINGQFYLAESIQVVVAPASNYTITIKERETA